MTTLDGDDSEQRRSQGDSARQGAPRDVGGEAGNGQRRRITRDGEEASGVTSSGNAPVP